MKKSFSKLLALALTASLVLSGCGGTSGSSDKEEDTSGKTEASGNEEAQLPALNLQPLTFSILKHRLIHSI